MIDGSRAYAQLNDNALIKTAEQIFAQVDAASDRSHIQPVLFLEINQSLVQTADPDTQKLEQLISFWRQKKRILYGQIVGLTHAIVRKIFLFLESTLPSLMIALREMVPSAPQLLELQPKIGKADLGKSLAQMMISLERNDQRLKLFEHMHLIMGLDTPTSPIRGIPFNHGLEEFQFGLLEKGVRKDITAELETLIQGPPSMGAFLRRFFFFMQFPFPLEFDIDELWVTLFSLKTFVDDMATANFPPTVATFLWFITQFVPSLNLVTKTIVSQVEVIAAPEISESAKRKWGMATGASGTSTTTGGSSAPPSASGTAAAMAPKGGMAGKVSGDVMARMRAKTASTFDPKSFRAKLSVLLSISTQDALQGTFQSSMPAPWQETLRFMHAFQRNWSRFAGIEQLHAQMDAVPTKRAFRPDVSFTVRSDSYDAWQIKPASALRVFVTSMAELPTYQQCMLLTSTTVTTTNGKQRASYMIGPAVENTGTVVQPGAAAAAGYAAGPPTPNLAGSIATEPAPSRKEKKRKRAAADRAAQELTTAEPPTDEPMLPPPARARARASGTQETSTPAKKGGRVSTNPSDTGARIPRKVARAGSPPPHAAAGATELAIDESSGAEAKTGLPQFPQKLTQSAEREIAVQARQAKFKWVYADKNFLAGRGAVNQLTKYESTDLTMKVLMPLMGVSSGFAYILTSDDTTRAVEQKLLR